MEDRKSCTEVSPTFLPPSFPALSSLLLSCSLLSLFFPSRLSSPSFLPLLFSLLLCSFQQFLFFPPCLSFSPSLLYSFQQYAETLLFVDLFVSGISLGILTAVELFLLKYERLHHMAAETIWELIKLGMPRPSPIPPPPIPPPIPLPPIPPRIPGLATF